MTLAAAFLVAVLSMGADNDRITLTESVDVVEVNHFFDDEGRRVFDQLLFYRWNGTRHELVDFRMATQRPECLPVRHGSRWECIWQDGLRWRRIRCASCRESWTQYDPEVVDREVLASDRRQKLRPK